MHKHIMVYKITPIGKALLHSDKVTVTLVEMINNTNQAKVEKIDVGGETYYILTKLLH